MENGTGLSRELQISLGEKLREHYGTFVQKLPLHLVALTRKIRGVKVSTTSPPPASGPGFVNNGEGGFDPETVAILSEAFDRAWNDLDYLEPNPATPTALSLCLIGLLNNGERNSSRLATKAVLQLIAPRVSL